MMKKTGITIVTLALFCSISFGSYSGGTGEANSPYQISTVSDWNDLMHTSSDWGKNFKMVADVNLKDVNVSPIGNFTVKFTGVFDGNDHKVFHVLINQPSNNNVGLFGYINNGQVKNLGIEDANITGGVNVGGLVGKQWSGTIYNCFARAFVKSIVSGAKESHAGGIAGSFLGTMSKSYSISVVSSYSDFRSTTGGLIGTFDGSINNCYSDAIVFSTSGANDGSIAGGLVGNGTGDIFNSYSMGSISSLGLGGLGGFIGSNYGNIFKCYSKGSVSSSINSYYLGGFAGFNSGTICDSYSTGSVASISSNAYVGGFIGYSSSGYSYRAKTLIMNCYSVGVVSGSSVYTGGFLGYDQNSSITASFWDIETSGQVTSVGGIGKTTAEMKDVNTFINAEWNFADEIKCIAGNWIARENNYPKLAWECYALVDIPNLNGFNILEAESILNNLGIKINQTYLICDSLTEAGRFSYSEPNYGVYVYSGLSKIDIFISASNDPGYSGGQGTPENPYQISSACDWQRLMNDPNNWDKNFILTQDIYLGKMDITPIGNATTKFNGVFNGNNHCICNAVITQTGNQYVGLFGYINDAEIKHLNVIDANISGSSNVGGLVGCSSSSIISDCTSSGFIKAYYNYGNSSGGGLIGSQSGSSIEYSSSSMRVRAINNSSNPGEPSYSLGGLLGHNYNGSVSNSYAVGSVNCDILYAKPEIGGLIGDNDGNVCRCYATTSVNTTLKSNSNSTYLQSFVGGLTGINSGTIDSSYFKGTLTCTDTNGATFWAYSIGGIAGENYGKISATYSLGTLIFLVNGIYNDGCFLGGLVGINDIDEGIISNCYSAFQLSGSGTYYLMGGLIAQGYKNINASFFDFEKVGISQSWGGKGLTTAEMKNMKNYQNAEWAGKGWVMQDGVDYPHLEWEGTEGVPIPEAEPVPLSGNGTEAEPYQIWTAEDFASLSYYTAVLDKNIKLMTDVNLTGKFIYPIGNIEPFTGVFDGNNHTISNADINQPYVYLIGLFGSIGTGGKILNLHVEDVNIIGGIYSGGLAGYSSGEITSCSITGQIESRSYSGGLVGCNTNGRILDSSANVVYRGYSWLSYTGGLVGYNKYGAIERCCSSSELPYTSSYNGGLIGSNYYGSVSNCYATGNIGTKNDIGSYIGGLIGNNNSGTVSNCYATGAVGKSGNNTSYHGGLAGANSGAIDNCFATGIVTSSGNHSGGLVGNNSGMISNCYSLGSVTTGNTTSKFGDAGGLAGSSSGTIINCYSTGSVTGKSNSTSCYFGGSIGQNSGTIKNCYAIGDVNVLSKSNMIAIYIGGFVGYNYKGTILNCYSTGKVINDYSGSKIGGLVGYRSSGDVNISFWDKQTSGQATSAGGTGKTTADMKTLSTFTNVGWDFMGESVNGPNDIWRMCVDGKIYPRLSWEYSAHGDFDCPDGTDVGDLYVFSDQWLLEESYVNFIDFAILADGWNGDINELYDLSVQWLEPRSYDADIASGIGGDGIVNMRDFAEFAEHWFEEF
jgi:hypothetical protein